MCVSILLLTSVVSLVAGAPQKATRQALAEVLRTNAAFECLPEDDGFFEDPQQCDMYWHCTPRVPTATPYLCDDGLVYDQLKSDAGHVDPCDTPQIVDCTGREDLQLASYPNDYCPRRHGSFPDPDLSICTRFHTCKAGHKESSTDCTTGLHYDPNTGTCTWPHAAARLGCVEETTNCIKNGNFCCTGEQVFTADGLLQPHPAFTNFEDCQKFYVCLNNKTPQESSCSLGQVYNERTSLCDYPENVPECKDFYLNHPLYDILYDEANGRRDLTLLSTIN